jgi:hypothetical protein
LSIVTIAPSGMREEGVGAAPSGRSSFPIRVALAGGYAPADATNPNDPAYHWPKVVEGDVPQAQGFGMAPMLQIGKTPEWASGNPDPRFPPMSTSDFTDFLIAVARRYPSVRYWMIWSEACSHTRFQPITLQASARRSRPMLAFSRVPTHSFSMPRTSRSRG